MLRLVEVSKRYGREKALDGVSLHVRPGDCYGFLGHNGAGKTTALRIALGLIRPDRGRVFVDGFDVAEYPREARARVGGLIETPGFYGWMSGRANLRHLARLAGLSPRAAAREADRLLELAGLSFAGDRRVSGYSQGMRQRLGIAAALTRDPPIVLLDEPGNGLDPEGIEQFRRLLVRLTKDEGRTVLLSSHQLHEISGVCDRIGILRQGRLLTEAPTDELTGGAAARLMVRTDDPDRSLLVLAERGIFPEPAGGDGMLLPTRDADAAQVARILVGAGIGVRELTRRAASLEEVYLRLSREGGAAPAAGPDPAPPPGAPLRRRAPRWPVLRAAAGELRRLASHPAPALVLALPLALAALAVLRLRSAGAEAAGAYSSTLVTAFEGVAVALGSSLPLLALVAAGLASQSIAAEHSRGTLRNLLLLPLGRVRLALGKALGVLLAVAAAYTVLAAVSVGAAAAAFDFTDVVEILEIRTAEPWVLVPADALWPPFLTLLPAMLAPIAAYACLGFLMGALSRRSVTGLVLAVGAVAVLDLARVVGQDLGFEPALLSAYVTSPTGDFFGLGDTSRVAHLTELIRSPNDVPVGYLGTSILVPLIWAVASLGLSALALRRRSVP